jgi:hypothetical protein
MHYGFHSISTAFVGAMLLQARKAIAFHRARATNAKYGWEEHSQSLARPESIGVLACEALRCESLRTLTQNQFTTDIQRIGSWRRRCLWLLT